MASRISLNEEKDFPSCTGLCHAWFSPKVLPLWSLCLHVVYTYIHPRNHKSFSTPSLSTYFSPSYGYIKKIEKLVGKLCDSKVSCNASLISYSCLFTPFHIFTQYFKVYKTSCILDGSQTPQE